MNILITGANGQLGNEMRVLSAAHPQHTYFFTDVQELDICDADAVRAFIADRRVDVVVNCAAYTAVDKAEDNPELCDRLNHLAPGYLAEAAEAVGAALIQVSTDYVFDGTAHVPYREDDTPCPNSVYGRTKLAGEEVVMQKCSRAMIVRTAWLYSTFGNNFVKTMLRLGRERESLGVVFDQIGTPTYAADLAQAIFAAIEQGIVPGIYHFSDEGVRLHYGHSSPGGHHYVSRQPLAHGRISGQGTPSALLCARQDAHQANLWHRHPSLGGIAGRVLGEIEN